MQNLTEKLFFWVGVTLVLGLVGYLLWGGPGAGAGFTVGFIATIIAALIVQNKNP